METIKKDVYSIVTDRVIEQLEKGVIPWKQLWYCKTGMPMNFISKKE